MSDRRHSAKRALLGVHQEMPTPATLHKCAVCGWSWMTWPSMRMDELTKEYTGGCKHPRFPLVWHTQRSHLRPGSMCNRMLRFDFSAL